VSAGGENMGTACVVSIEVDGRQRYIFETDKLREMLGASRVIDGTRAKAHDLFPEPNVGTPCAGSHLFAPVSGEIRAWAPLRERERDELLDKAWELCEYLRENGVGFTVAYTETSAGHLTVTRRSDRNSDGASLKDLHREISKRVRALKNAKPWPDARPRCSLFVACRIHGHDAANSWQPQRGKRTGEEDEPRRELTSFRALAKLSAWKHYRNGFYDHLLRTPVMTRFRDLSARSILPGGQAIDPQRAITFRDLSDSLDSDEPAEDQFIAFLKADGDGMGNVLTHLDWNAPEWGDDGKPPWLRNAEFSSQLEDLVRRALGEAIAEVVLPYGGEHEDQTTKTTRQENAEHLRAGKRVDLPILPQLQGGEDLWIVCTRKAALDLACAFAKLFQAYANGHPEYPAVREAIRVAQEVACVHAGEPRPAEVLTMSIGVAFAKAGYPVHAMVDAAESLLKSAKALRKNKIEGRILSKTEGCIDWYWIESSLSESVDDSRWRGWEYQDGNTLFRLTTRPWSVSETEACVKAARALQKIARRKREQLESILRRGERLSELAWESWRKTLTATEGATLDAVNTALKSLRVENIASSPWLPGKPVTGLRVNGQNIEQERATPLLDLLSLQHVYGWEGRADADDRREDDHA